MRTNTRLLFRSLLRKSHADCVFDVGSCDGSDSVRFRHSLPSAVIAAFEANPLLYRKMTENSNLRANRIDVFNCAISDKNGTAPFHVIDLDYHDPVVENPGVSSLLVHEGLKEKETVQVETRRVDEFLKSKYPNVRRVGLWIDAEGAEFQVIEGIGVARDLVVAMHVETARAPMRVGQKVYSELEPVIRSLGFIPVGTNMSSTDNWGDVVFLNEKVKADIGFKFHLCVGLAWLGYWSGASSVLGFLKANCGPAYRMCWRILGRFF